MLCTATLLWGVACTSSSDNGGETPGGGGTGGGGDVTEINGTKITEGNNLVGLIKDTAGNPVVGVPVTDGYTYVTTDNNGVYQMTANRYCRNVYYSTPSNYKVALNATNHLPLFYSTTTIDRSKTNRNDFTLEPITADETNFTLVAISDPQCKTDSDVNRFKSETLPDICETLENGESSNRFLNPYAVTLGDITFDNTVQWDPMVKAMSNLKYSNKYLPIFNCVGNHDHNAANSSDYTCLENYVKRLGPVDYSFNRGNAHIVVMDNVVYASTNGSTCKYYAGFSTAQYNWLKADLNLVANKSDKLVILCCHIPFRSGGNATGSDGEPNGSNVNNDKYYTSVLSLLKEFNEAHIMIGHTHYPQNYTHTEYVCKGGKPVYEHVHAAACGGWWYSNICVDGTPNGYAIYEIRGNSVYNHIAKSTNLNESYQMRVYNGSQTYTGTKGQSYNWASTYSGCFVASVWNDDADNWRVEFIQNGVATAMKRVTSATPDQCSVSFFFNELGKTTTTWTKALTHYWYIKAPGGNPATEQNWSIKATQTVPTSGKTNVYTANTLQTDYTGFAMN